MAARSLWCPPGYDLGWRSRPFSFHGSTVFNKTVCTIFTVTFSHWARSPLAQQPHGSRSAGRPPQASVPPGDTLSPQSGPHGFSQVWSPCHILQMLQITEPEMWLQWRRAGFLADLQVRGEVRGRGPQAGPWGTRSLSSEPARAL